MEKQIALGAENFSHRLNMSGFTNIEKSYSTEQFNKTFTSEEYNIFDKANIVSFVNDLQKAFGTEIKKGGFNDLPEIHATIEKAKEDLKSLKSVFITDGPGTEHNIFVMEKAKKSEDTEIKKANIENELEKGCMDSFEYSKNFQFSKKGKDIKEKVALLKVEEELKTKQIEKDIETALENCDNNPTENYSGWGLRSKIKHSYKVFNWNQTYYNQGSNCEMKADSGKSIQAAASPEEAQRNSKYNSLVSQWVECQVELLLMDLYIKNLDDKKSYDLTSEQMVTLNF